MEDQWNEYLINGTNVLKNKLGITSKEELTIKEDEVVFPKLTELHLKPIINDCDITNLKKVHKFLFEDIYPFAGEYRKCTLSKNGYNFLEPERIDSESIEIFSKYNCLIDNAKTPDELAFILAPFYYDLIRIHPFREGNGRSIREFIRETVLLKNKKLPFDVELDYTKMDKDNMMQGVKNRYFFPSMLEMEFMKGLVPIEKDKHI